MISAHDAEVALTSAAALVNTGRGGEELPEEAALDRFVAAWEVTGGHAHDRAELNAVRALRPRLARLWELTEDDAATFVNALLRETRARIGS